MAEIIMKAEMDKTIEILLNLFKEKAALKSMLAL